METSLQATTPLSDSTDVFMPLVLAIIELTEQYNNEKASPPMPQQTLSPTERLH